MKTLIYLGLLLLSFQTSAAVLPRSAYATVTQAQFEKGHFWIWLYSEFLSPTNTWVPYLEERYTVTEVIGKNITIEMSSGEPGSGGLLPAHHKFKMDFKKCELQKANPTYKHWTLQFFTKSFSGNWDVVSYSHMNAVFTEKFNCAKIPDVIYMNLDFAGSQQIVFQEKGHAQLETSWYFLNHPELKGVASHKFFKPDDLYKQELIEFGKTQRR